jgi:hypothetical protein
MLLVPVLIVANLLQKQNVRIELTKNLGCRDNILIFLFEGNRFRRVVGEPFQIPRRHRPQCLAISGQQG